MIAEIPDFIQWMRHNWAALAIAGTCLSLIVFVILLLHKYVTICLNIFTDTPLPMSLGTCDFPILKGEEVRFRSFDGISLRGLWLRSRRAVPSRSSALFGDAMNEPPYRGTIVFCHEFGSDMYSCARYARPLMDAGFDVFTFDFRGHGGSSSSTPNYRLLQWASDKELEDVLGACAYVGDVLESEGRPRTIGLFGISRGACAGLLAASSDNDISCLVCDGAFSTPETLISLMKRWAHIFAKVALVYENHPEFFWQSLLWLVMCFAQRRLGRKFLSVSKALKTMSARPIFFIHGEKDSYIRKDHSQLLYDLCGQPKYLWVVPTAKHNQSVTVAKDEYALRTVAFFRKYLANEDVSQSELSGGLTRADVA